MRSRESRGKGALGRCGLVFGRRISRLSKLAADKSFQSGIVLGAKTFGICFEAKSSGIITDFSFLGKRMKDLASRRLDHMIL